MELTGVLLIVTLDRMSNENRNGENDVHMHNNTSQSTVHNIPV